MKAFFGQHQGNSWWALALAVLVPLAARAEEPLAEGARQHFASLAPAAAAKFAQRRPVHVVFVGEAHLLACPEAPERGFPQIWLHDLAQEFRCSGGVHDIYDPAHLEQEDDKITYEIHARPRATSFALLQLLSTVALVNSPDLIVAAIGGADAEEGLPLETLGRIWDRAAATVRQQRGDLIMLGPSVIASAETTGPRLVATGAYAAWAGTWATKRGVPWCDANLGLLPSSLLFSPKHSAEAVWRQLQDSLDRGQRGSFSPGQHQRLASVLDEFMRPPSAPRGYRVSPLASGGSVALENLAAESRAGFFFPLGQEGRAMALAAKEKAPVPLAVSARDRGRELAYFLIVDQRNVWPLAFSAEQTGMTADWITTAQRGLAGPFAASVRVFHALPKLPFRWQWQGQEQAGQTENRSDGTVEIQGQFPVTAGIGVLELALGSDGQEIRLKQNVEVAGHMSLGQKRELRCDDSALLGPSQEEAILRPGVFLEAEATEDDLVLQFDLRKIVLDPHYPQALRLALAIDARPPEACGTLGHVGELLIEAGPEDGPGTVGKMDLAQFGDGYDRVPKPAGVQARLAPMPDGTRRLTVRLARRFFHAHPWQLGRASSFIGLGCVLELRVADQAKPIVFRLLGNKIHPRNAESLAILELSREPSARWSIHPW